MTTPSVTSAALVAASGACLLATYRLLDGPSLPDRMVALDTITTTIVAISALYSIATGREFYLLVSLVLGIIGFVSTVAVAKFVEEGDIIE
jgi:Multisubunit Na+/H+ antiporter, MnhF subunit